MVEASHTHIRTLMHTFIGINLPKALNISFNNRNFLRYIPYHHHHRRRHHHITYPKQWFETKEEKSIIMIRFVSLYFNNTSFVTFLNKFSIFHLEKIRFITICDVRNISIFYYKLDNMRHKKYIIYVPSIRLSACSLLFIKMYNCMKNIEFFSFFSIFM